MKNSKRFKFDYFLVGMIIFLMWEIAFIYLLATTKPTNVPRYSNEFMNTGFNLNSVFIIIPLVLSLILTIIGAIQKNRAEKSPYKRFFDTI